MPLEREQNEKKIIVQESKQHLNNWEYSQYKVMMENIQLFKRIAITGQQSLFVSSF